MKPNQQINDERAAGQLATESRVIWDGAAMNGFRSVVEVLSLSIIPACFNASLTGRTQKRIG